jgi:ribose transport system permease protein
VLQTGLAQVGATEPTKRVITGAVIVLAVIADVQRRSWSSSARRPWSRLIPPSLRRRPDR